MIPFLKSVALAYSTRYSDLSDICFLFPNKRGGRFFLKYLRDCNPDRTVLAPEIKTVSEFMSDLSQRVVASRLDLIFMLFEEYKNLLGREGADDTVAFDSFRMWGETVISDFSEVDQYLASPEEVFKNVKDFRELSSNYLTDDQKEVIKEYFGQREVGDAKGFWKHFNVEGGRELGEAKRRFMHLWQLMMPLYESLNRKLAEEGLATTGGNTRLALKRLREKGREALPYKKVVAVGFNALTTAEFNIFRELQKQSGYEGYDKFIDFIWDVTGPILESENNSASRFVKADISHFPAPEWAMGALRQSHASGMPDEISIEASPSNAAQTKIVGILLRDLHEQSGDEPFASNKVAVVLPDENLLLPMLYSLPKGIGDVNLTMGYSLRLTSVVPYVTLLRRLLSNSRVVDGERGYYHKSLRQFLSHPYSHSLDGTKSVGRLIGELDRRHIAVMTLEEIKSYLPVIGNFLEKYNNDLSPVATIEWLDTVLEQVTSSLERNDMGGMKKRLERNHLSVYRDSLNRLADIIGDYSVSMKPQTVFRLLDTLLAGETVGFEGEPLSGLQVMGPLETRSLDFEHIYILSANEKVLPRRMRTRSFIPDTLRRAYGMPPSNYAEEMFAYYFYRMISRAKKVTIVYDGRDNGDNGAISRYILQLRYLFAPGDKMRERDWKFLLSSPSETDPSVEKTPKVMELLSRFEKDVKSCGVKSKSRDERTLNFSASSLNIYRDCGVRFFYQTVLGINPDRTPSEFVDAITSGNVLHRIMQNIYVPSSMTGKYLATGIVVTPERIARLLDDRASLWREVVRSVNQEHFHLPEEDRDRSLSGGAEMVGRKILQQVINILEYDQGLAPFTIHGVEINELLRVRLRSGKSVNFRFAIDRLDRVNVEGREVLRIVDYKTGKLKLEAEDMDDLFTSGFKKEQAFQLFLYSWLLQKRGGVEGATDVRLEIYNANAIGKEIPNLPKIGSEAVNSSGELSSAFDDGIDRLIESVFEDGRFEAAEKSECEICGFKDLCRR